MLSDDESWGGAARCMSEAVKQSGTQESFMTKSLHIVGRWVKGCTKTWVARKVTSHTRLLLEIHKQEQETGGILNVEEWLAGGCL